MRTKLPLTFCFSESESSAIGKKGMSAVSQSTGGRKYQNGSNCRRIPKSRRQEQPPEAIPPLTASVMEQWNDGIVPVRSWNGWEP